MDESIPIQEPTRIKSLYVFRIQFASIFAPSPIIQPRSIYSARNDIINSIVHKMEYRSYWKIFVYLKLYTTFLPIKFNIPYNRCLIELLTIQCHIYWRYRIITSFHLGIILLITGVNIAIIYILD